MSLKVALSLKAALSLKGTQSIAGGNAPGKLASFSDPERVALVRSNDLVCGKYFVEGATLSGSGLNSFGSGGVAPGY
jgi:hypothetical protein